jgi:toxin ParE1/3/4
VRIVWSPLAVDQAEQAFASIGAERPAAARRWLEELFDRTSSLAHFPDMGRIVPETRRPAVREVLVAPYRVIYRRDDTQVVILAVRHVRRDFDGKDLEAPRS